MSSFSALLLSTGFTWSGPRPDGRRASTRRVDTEWMVGHLGIKSQRAKRTIHLCGIENRCLRTNLQIQTLASANVKARGRFGRQLSTGLLQRSRHSSLGRNPRVRLKAWLSGLPHCSRPQASSSCTRSGRVTIRALPALQQPRFLRSCRRMSGTPG